MIQSICFDLFNTLVSVARVPESVGRFTADILGIDRLIWRKACFGPEHNIRQATDSFQTLLQLAHSIDPEIPIARVQLAVEERQARFDYALLNVEQNILRVLQCIHNKGIKFGLISNASSGEVQAWPDSPLAELFDAVSFSCHCGKVKPEPAIYHHTLDELAIAPEHCLFVGDGSSDEHFGAYSVGMKPVLITHYLHTGERPERLAKYRDVLFRVVDKIEQLDEGLLQGQK